MASSLPINGYLYTAWGDDHVKEAVNSATILRKHDPTAHVTLATSRPVYTTTTDLTDGYVRYNSVIIDAFDRVIVKENIRDGFAGKVDCLSNEYYVNTFYLDTDTYVCEDPSGLFNLLKYFDLCAVLDPAEIDISMQGLTPYNTGVLLFGSNTTKLFETFKRYYNDEERLNNLLKWHPAKDKKTDQPSFMMAIRDTEIKVHSLPNVWNARYRFNISLMGKVKIIHGPNTNFEKLLEVMNKFDKGFENRYWDSSSWDRKYGY